MIEGLNQNTGTPDYQKLFGLMSLEEDLKLDRLSPQILEEKINRGEAVLIKDEMGQPKAFGAIWETSDPLVVEIGTIWTHPEFRGRGLSGEVFSFLQGAVGLRTAFLISRSKIISELASGFDFVEVTDLSGYPEIQPLVSDRIRLGQEKKLFVRRGVPISS